MVKELPGEFSRQRSRIESVHICLNLLDIYGSDHAKNFTKNEIRTGLLIL